MHIISDVWSTVELKEEGQKLIWTAAALDVMSMRKSKKGEVERRVREMRDDLGIPGLRLDRHDDQEWTRGNSGSNAFQRHGPRLVSHILIYESG